MPPAAAPERPVRLDHLCYVPGDEGLAACVQRLGARLGAPFADGGIHPTFGTRNFVLPMADDCYLEVVGLLDHPAVDRAPFGRAVRARIEDGGGWLAWVVRVDDIGAVEQRLSRPSAPGRRRRPDGVELRWRQIGINDVAMDPQLPFFVAWDVPADLHPSAGGSPVRLRGLEIAGDRTAIADYVGVPPDVPFAGIDVEWREPGADGTGIVAAAFETPSGEVRID